MVFFKFKRDEYNKEKCGEFLEFMKARNIVMNEAWEPNYELRVVTHHYIRENEANTFIKAIKEFIE